MTIHTRTGLLGALALAATMTACSGSGPTSPSLDPAATGPVKADAGS